MSDAVYDTGSGGLQVIPKTLDAMMGALDDQLGRLGSVATCMYVSKEGEALEVLLMDDSLGPQMVLGLMRKKADEGATSITLGGEASKVKKGGVQAYIIEKRHNPEFRAHDLPAWLREDIVSVAYCDRAGRKITGFSSIIEEGEDRRLGAWNMQFSTGDEATDPSGDMVSAFDRDAGRRAADKLEKMARDRAERQ